MQRIKLIRSFAKYYLLLAIFICKTFANGNELTFLEYVKIIRKTHPIFSSTDMKVSIQRKEQEKIAFDQEWHFSTTFEMNTQKPSIPLNGPEKNDEIGISANLGKSFWNTGGQIQAYVKSEVIKLDINPFYNIPKRMYQNQIGVIFNQPLIRNRNGLLSRLQYDLQTIDISLTELKADEEKEMFLVEMQNIYFDLVMYCEQERICKQRVELMRQEKERTEKKRAYNLVDKINVVRADDAVQTALSQLITIQAQKAAIESELSVLLDYDSITTIIPSFCLYKFPDLPSLQQAVIEMFENSEVLKILQANMTRLERLKLGYKERTKPEMLLAIGAIISNADEIARESYLVDDFTGSIELTLELPLKNKRALIDLQKSEMQCEIIRKQISQVKKELKSKAMRMHALLEKQREILQSDNQLIEIATRRIDEEKAMFQKGRNELTSVILSQDHLAQAKIVFAQNAAFYHKLFYQYLSLIGRSF